MQSCPRIRAREVRSGGRALVWQPVPGLVEIQARVLVPRQQAPEPGTVSIRLARQRREFSVNRPG